MRALFIKEFQELKRDRRTLAMIIMLPLLLLLVFGYAAQLWLPLSIMALQCVLLFGAATARLARSLRSI